MRVFYMTYVCIYKVAGFVRLCVCVPDFGKTCRPISMKLFVVHRGQRRLERKKIPENVDP